MLMYFLLILLGILIFLGILIKQTLLPKETIERIEFLQKEPIPELLKGKTGYAQNGRIRLFYEVLSKDENPIGDILLIMGHSHFLTVWPAYFYQPFIDAGYRVIRYDNRGLGNSDWIENWSKDTAYNLEDMAIDALAVLDALASKEAHIIGLSMGGMIGQRLAISHGERVKSLTSIMSTSNFFDNGIIPPIKFALQLFILQKTYGSDLKKESNKIKMFAAIRRLLIGKGGYDFNQDTSITLALYEIRNRNGFNGRAADQHSLAIKKSGSRYDELKQIKAPTLVIHGTDDPLIFIQHAKKYAPQIPNAKTLYVKGMGHDLPECYMTDIHKEILNHFQN